MISLQEQQEILLNIMHQTHEYCRKNHLRYCLAYGTLIGAVRHKGFIPWDNDVDIFMPRPDFEWLLNDLKERQMGDNLSVIHYTTDPKYHYSVARIYDNRTRVRSSALREPPEKMGIYMDIFPVDGYWTKEEKRSIRYKKLRFNQRLQSADLYAMKERKGLKAKLKWISHFFFPGRHNKHPRKIDQYCKQVDYDSREKVIDMAEYLHFDTWLTHEDFNDPILVPFEQFQFYIPQRYHEFLTAGYGDYMTLPPEDAREVHDFDAEWL